MSHEAIAASSLNSHSASTKNTTKGTKRKIMITVTMETIIMSTSSTIFLLSTVCFCTSLIVRKANTPTTTRGGSTYKTITTIPIVGSGSVTSKHTEPLIGMVTESGTKFGADPAKRNRNSPQKITKFTFGFWDPSNRYVLHNNQKSVCIHE